MQYILENYMIIIFVGLFFVFALIGYLVDMLKNSKEEDKVDMPEVIKPIEIKDIKDDKNTKNSKEIVDTKDDLLENYNDK